MSIFKIFRTDEWQDFSQAHIFTGSADDVRDGFIHFSSEETLAGTLAKYFKDDAEIVIAQVDNPKWSDHLRWELSRGGASFPHLYTALYLDDVIGHWTLEKAGEQTSDQAWDLSVIAAACKITFAPSDV
ncbi:MAG: DUF952 domain-containing protein [Maricaulaceae bacterium]